MFQERAEHAPMDRRDLGITDVGRSTPKDCHHVPAEHGGFEADEGGVGNELVHIGEVSAGLEGLYGRHEVPAGPAHEMATKPTEPIMKVATAVATLFVGSP